MLTNFYAEQFSKMYSPEVLIIWILAMICLVFDVWLIKKGSISYLKKSISILTIPKKYRVLSLAKLKSIPEFRLINNQENTLFIIPTSLSHFYLFPNFKMRIENDQTVAGEVQISLLKTIHFVFGILFFYFLLTGEWGKNFENAFGSFMGLPKVYYFLVFSVFINLGYGIWAALSILADARLER